MYSSHPAPTRSAALNSFRSHIGRWGVVKTVELEVIRGLNTDTGRKVHPAPTRRRHTLTTGDGIEIITLGSQQIVETDT